MKPNMHKDLQRKCSERKSANAKNKYKIANEAKNGTYKNNNIGDSKKKNDMIIIT